MSGSVGRNLGLVLALVALVVVGAITAGEQLHELRATSLVILRQASIIGVISIGMTFVIIAGGIDLSVGSVMGLAIVVATLAAIQDARRSDPLDRDGRRSRSRSGVGRRAHQRHRDRLRQGRRVHGDPRHAGRAHAGSPRSSPSVATLSRRRTADFISFMNSRLHRRRHPHLDLRDRRRARLGPAQPHHVRSPHRRDRRQPRGGAPGGHQRQAPHHVALRARRA